MVAGHGVSIENIDGGRNYKKQASETRQGTTIIYAVDIKNKTEDIPISVNGGGGEVIAEEILFEGIGTALCLDKHQRQTLRLLRCQKIQEEVPVQARRRTAN